MKLIMQRASEDRTLLNVVRLQQLYRRTLTPDSVSLAWQEAIAAEAQKRFATQSTQPAPKPKPEPPKRPRCETHFEKKFVFSDGTVWQCCTHDECLFGKGRKTHSDRLPHPPIEVEDDETVESEVEPEEVELDDVQELSVESVIEPLEDRDENELEVAEPELGTDDDEDESQDEAESFEEAGEREW